jgi:hypothetical protein
LTFASAARPQPIADRCSPRTIELEEERLSIVKRHLGDLPLSAITATTIAVFQRTRHETVSRGI